MLFFLLATQAVLSTATILKLEQRLRDCTQKESK